MDCAHYECSQLLSEFGWINPEVEILPLNSESPVQRLLQLPFEGLSKVVYKGQVAPLVSTDCLVDSLPSISSHLYISGPSLIYC